jgi:rhodanese-related sulfurtransferase
MTNLVTREDLKQAIDDGDAILVEALSAKDFAEGHLPGAVNVPADDAETVAAQVLPDKNAKIITYCGSAECPKSEILAQKLREQGYTNVSEYKEGKKGWVGAGLPLDQGSLIAQAGADTLNAQARAH